MPVENVAVPVYDSTGNLLPPTFNNLPSNTVWSSTSYYQTRVLGSVTYRRTVTLTGGAETADTGWVKQ